MHADINDERPVVASSTSQPGRQGSLRPITTTTTFTQHTSTAALTNPLSSNNESIGSFTRARAGYTFRGRRLIIYSHYEKQQKTKSPLVSEREYGSSTTTFSSLLLFVFFLVFIFFPSLVPYVVGIMDPCRGPMQRSMIPQDVYVFAHARKESLVVMWNMHEMSETSDVCSILDVLFSALLFCAGRRARPHAHTTY